MSNSVASDFNLQKLNTKELAENLRATIEFGGNVYICGSRGTGKTCISKDVIKSMGYKEVYGNVSTFDRCDFNGFPDFINSKSKYVNFLLPKFFESLIETDKPCVALLDEVDKSPPELWAALLEFCQFRTVNGRPLPNLKAIIMTGNLIAEGGQKPISPLLNRCENYLLESSTTQWLDWAATPEARIHPSISAYLSDNPQDLFGEVDMGDLYVDPTARGWHNASKILNFGEENKWPNRILTTKVSGCIGKKTGIKYSSYFDHYQILLPIVEKIMKGEEVKGFGALEPSKQLISCMIACSRLSRLIDDRKPSDKELPVEANAVAKFLKNVDPEMALISVRSQIGLQRTVESSLDDLPAFDEILRSIAKRIG